jgi:predicted N-formylglutamate amidohydrolase
MIRVMTELGYERIGGSAASGLILMCDHAANALPPGYGTLGLAPDLLATHIAYDIGAAHVTRRLAELFGAPALLGLWSRLLIDLNRGEDDPTLVMKLSDGSVIPGNRDAKDDDIARRIRKYHAPYHDAIDEEIMLAHDAGRVPALISIHSFTPNWKGRVRRWDFGVLWDRDDRLAGPLMEELRAAGFEVGDNEPYSGELENDSMYRHGTAGGLPHVLIEIRQDLIATAEAARAIADRLHGILCGTLSRSGEPQLRFTRPLLNGDDTMDEQTRQEVEAAVFRRLVAHLRTRTDVQNIDLMITGGFCRNCLGDWYREVAAEKGIALDKDDARAVVYGMPPAEWKKRYQKEVTPEKQAEFQASSSAAIGHKK